MDSFTDPERKVLTTKARTSLIINYLVQDGLRAINLVYARSVPRLFVSQAFLLAHELLQVTEVNGVLVAEVARNVRCLDQAVAVLVELQEGLPY